MSVDGPFLDDEVNGAAVRSDQVRSEFTLEFEAQAGCGTTPRSCDGAHPPHRSPPCIFGLRSRTGSQKCPRAQPCSHRTPTIRCLSGQTPASRQGRAPSAHQRRAGPPRVSPLPQPTRRPQQFTLLGHTRHLTRILEGPRALGWHLRRSQSEHTEEIRFRYNA